MAKRRDRITDQDLPRLREALAGEDAPAQQEALRLLCPCRNRVYEPDIWRAIFRAADDGDDKTVRDQAGHAIATLRQRVSTDPRAEELVRALVEQGVAALPEQELRPLRREKIRAGDLPRLREALDGDNPEAQQKALRLLCPCRNRVYDRELWLMIFQAYHEAQNGAVRDQAGHAIGTLMERARTDPRSQELLRWLASQGVSSLPLEEAIPSWQPRARPATGPRIPRPPRPHRSKANRARR